MQRALDDAALAQDGLPALEPDGRQVRLAGRVRVTCRDTAGPPFVPPRVAEVRAGLGHDVHPTGAGSLAELAQHGVDTVLPVVRAQQPFGGERDRLEDGVALMQRLF